MKELEKYNIILASGSPRRQQFFEELHIPYTVQLKPIDEVFPESLKRQDIPEFLAQLKADAFNNLQPNDILVTGDTIVWHNNKALNKPKSKADALDMLKSLQNSSHEVISAFCIKTSCKTIVKSDVTQVYFKQIPEKEILYYIDNFQPYDKAGAYGIQEWIGKIGISKIEGSYFNVMGFPTHLFYESLKNLINENS